MILFLLFKSVKTSWNVWSVAFVTNIWISSIFFHKSQASSFFHFSFSDSLSIIHSKLTEYLSMIDIFDLQNNCSFSSSHHHYHHHYSQICTPPAINLTNTPFSIIAFLFEQVSKQTVIGLLNAFNHNEICRLFWRISNTIYSTDQLIINMTVRICVWLWYQDILNAYLHWY